MRRRRGLNSAAMDSVEATTASCDSPPVSARKTYCKPTTPPLGPVEAILGHLVDATGPGGNRLNARELYQSRRLNPPGPLTP